MLTEARLEWIPLGRQGTAVADPKPMTLSRDRGQHLSELFWPQMLTSRNRDQHPLRQACKRRKREYTKGEGPTIALF